MNRSIRLFWLALALGCGLNDALAQPLALPLESRQTGISINLQSVRGVPISAVTNVPPGSDGRMSITNESIGSVNLPTTNQFRGLMSFGAVPGLTRNNWLNLTNYADLQAGTNPFNGSVAAEMGLPVGRSDGTVGSSVVIALRRVMIGAPYLGRQISFQFGSEIPAPVTDELGRLLTNTVSSSFWLPRPYFTTNNSDTAQGFYWSPHAKTVFAIQSGPISVTWIKGAAYTASSLPAYTNLNGAQNFFTNGASIYELFTSRYVVSASAVKPTQHIYWTETPFNNSGQLVSVPQGSVTAVNVVYNNNFPERVAQAYVDPNSTPPVNSTNSFQELRTLWYEYNTIHAFNQEGRAFVELLGEPNPDGSRRFLGFEIVDVYKEPSPTDVIVELGERVTAYADGRDDSALYPAPLINTPQKFYYRQTSAGSDQLKLYATYATAHLNDFQSYWLISGVAGLRWPYLFNRYQQVWPDDATKYTHYVRSSVPTEAEAAATAVQLPGPQAPQMPYQDPLPQPFGAKLSPGGLFYTYLDSDHPAHRALLQYNVGNNVAFQRVFSWLDVNLKTTNFANTIATNLTSVSDYLNYPGQLAAYYSYLTNLAAYSNYVSYTNYLARRSRGVNGDWFLFGGQLTSNGSTGTLASWAVVVETQAAGGGPKATNEFSSVGFTFPANGYTYNATTVAGITNAVTALRLKVSGLTHPNPSQLFLQFNSPLPQAYNFPIYAQGGTSAVSSLNLLFDDGAATTVGSSVTSGSYRPGSGAMATLLLPAVAEVPRPADPFITSPPPAVAAPTPALAPWVSPFNTPRFVTALANVGDRIVAPNGELGSTSNYLAGYILQTNGNCFNPRAYLNPFAVGFTRANQGAIIPVNAIPGTNNLEVWWFRADNADVSRGFQPVYWPSVIGRYRLQWPTDADEIVLASNDGSGPLDSLQARGSIYRQNDRTLPGYNPNEEHALMFAGQAYALADDLNITNTGPSYSSAPYTLLDYTGPDGRPAMRAFRVRREKPEAGILFDYVANAGSLLQAPMPLPLMAPPVDGPGQYATNYNTEPPVNSGDLPIGWDNSFTNSALGHYARFTFQDRKREFWVYRGLHAGLPDLKVGSYVPTNGSFAALPPATALINQPFSYSLHVSRRPESLVFNVSNLPEGLAPVTTNGLAIVGKPTQTGSNWVTVLVNDTGDNSVVSNGFSLVVVSNGVLITQSPLTITSTNQYSGATVTFNDRPPFLAQPPTTTNSFTMRFYYKTDPSFDWPGLANPPAAGTIVPYLLPRNASGQLVGDPAARSSASLDIVYRPVWPSLVNGQPLPTLFSGETLTEAKHGLAAVRGQSSAQVLYQQSIGLNITTAPPAVVLYDPTVQKTSSLVAQGLANLPASVIARPYLGKFYFPNLPPNLVNRVFYDPNIKSLVVQGQFIDELVGEKYLLLNVLRGEDLAAVKALCPEADSSYKPIWDALVDRLATLVYKFHENPGIPGSYVADPTATVTNKIGELVEVNSSDTRVDSYALGAVGPGVGYVSYIVGDGREPSHAGEPVSVYILRVAPQLYPGELKVLLDPNPLSESVGFQHTADLAGRSGEYLYDWRIAPPVDGLAPITDPTNWTSLVLGTNLDHYKLGGSAGIQTLGDNYLSLRYRSLNPLAQPGSTNWSAWTPPQLAEGWIKRVLAGINPFNQRTSDLFNNPVNTTGSIISQAGHRWEGDVALNLSELNNYGLIEIYETVLNRGKAISINGGYNYGPANDALLLAAGYLNDLYMFIGNDAWADASNPTIGIGTADRTYGNVATALFAFKGQVASLLEEEQSLLRGRDDVLSPGVGLRPVYNRMFWNYTRGIDAGEVIYALNYNILDKNFDGVVNAADAAVLFPQGHGDAYGHYLTALGGYYTLLMNPNFDWVPRAETVSVLGAVVSVDYQDERKFATAAAAAARTGRQIFDLQWRQDYRPGTTEGWNYFGATRTNPQHTYSDGGTNRPVTRYWGMDHWASRVSQGAYLNWVVGNAILPAIDPDPAHQGIQRVDRTTVPELRELPTTADYIQNDLDNAEAGFTPLGLSKNSIPFDIDPLQVTGANPKTHFEQVYDRAVSTLNNAVVAFDDAQNVTQLMRAEEDSLANLQAATTNQELAYISQLIELFGTPYPDDMGPGKTYAQSYTGPDLLHYTYVENPDTNNFNGVIPDPTVANTFYVDIQNVPTNWAAEMLLDLGIVSNTDPRWANDRKLSIPFNIGPNGFFDKPADWINQRGSPGAIQQAISKLIAAQNRLRKVVVFETYDKQALDKAYLAFLDIMATQTNANLTLQQDLDLQKTINNLNEGYAVVSKTISAFTGGFDDTANMLTSEIPTENIFGLAFGGDQAKVAAGIVNGALYVAKQALVGEDLLAFIGTSAAVNAKQNQILDDTLKIDNSALEQSLKNGVLTLGNQLLALQGDLFTINEALRELDDAQRAYQGLIAKGNRILQERLTFRQHAAALVQGFRTRDAAFRIFQNEKLERYKTLFDLAAKYAFLAAQAYDYETGLLDTEQGKAFLNRIISARALGVVQNGQPQYAGSNTGDPGLSSALAEMKADWDVLRGRLGFNNPDGYGTTVSLRRENYRILNGTAGDNNWVDVLRRGQMTDLLSDPDIKRSCLQLDNGSGQPVPGIVLTFSTVISDGLNLFGQPLGPGDHNYSPSSFATKIFATGVDFDGYIGMDNPTPGNTAGGTSPPDPSLDPNALAATPYVYLIAVGADSMRSPPLGDSSAIRSWNVDDLTIPLPFNVSASDFSSKPFYISSDSLTEPLFGVRKNQAFRPVSTTDAFNTSIYGSGGALQPSQYTNKRLIGRSVWNSQWKLVIPGKTLLNNPNDGLNRFVRSVKDIKLYFVTYSYAGN